MIRVLPSILVALLLAFAAGCADPVSSAQGLVIQNPGQAERPYFHDYGNVPFGQAVTHVYDLLNTDPEPVVIRSVQGGCACIRVTSIDAHLPDGSEIQGKVRSKEEVLTVPPGALVKMAVRMDTSQLRDPNKDKLEILRLSTSSPNTPFPTFELHVKSQQLFQITPRRLVLGDVPTTSGKAGAIQIVTASFGDTARILRIESSGEHCEAELSEEVANGESLWTVHVRVPEFAPKGALRDELVLVTTDEYGEGEEGRERVEILAQVTDDVVANPRMISFASLKLGEAAKASCKLVALVPGARLLVENVSIEGEKSDSLEVEAVPLTPDASGAAVSWELHLHANDKLPAGRFAGNLIVSLDDSQTPEVKVPYSGFVR